jgi:hypothetical protein
MSDDSPLFVSAIELIAHSVDLYSKGKEHTYKFIILHLTNAVELILKDCLIDRGISIYKPNSPQTITIWKSFNKLETVDIQIPERPIIELLIDDRNTIQHRFGFPDAEAVFYYLRHVIAFFKRFLNDEYEVDLTELLQEYLSKDTLAIVGLAEGNEYSQLDKLFNLSPEAAVLQAYNMLEAKMRKIRLTLQVEDTQVHVSLWKNPYTLKILESLAEHGFISVTLQDIQELRYMRNTAAHFSHSKNESPPEWQKGLEIAKNILQGLSQAQEENFFQDYMLPLDKS